MLSRSALFRLSFLAVHCPWRTVIICLAVIFALAAGIKDLSFNNEYRVFFSKDNPQLLAFDAIQESYDKSDNVLFVVEPPKGDVFNTSVLQAIHRLTEMGWQLPYASRVDSVTNFQHTIAVEDELIVSDLISNPDALSDQDIQSIKKVALNEPLLVNRLISQSGHVSGVNVTVQLPENNPMVSLEIAASARKAVSEIEQAFPGLKIHLTGFVMMNNAFVESVLSDNERLVPVMYGIVILLLLLLLRSITATFCVVLIIVLSILPALGIFGWLGWALTPASASAPTIILTMAVADCVHILVSLQHHLKAGQEKRQAIQESLRVNFQPIFLTSITTAIGFLSMNFSDAPPYRDLGNLVAIGVIISFLLTIFLLPALLSLLPMRVKLNSHRDNVFMFHLSNFVIRHRRVLLVTNVLLVIVFCGLAPKNELNDEFVKYIDTSVEFRRATDFLNANMSGIYSLEIALSTDEEGGLNEPHFLATIEQLAHWLKNQPEVLHVNAITDIYKRLNKNMHEDDPAQYKLPETRDLAAQYLLLYEMSLPYGLDLNNQVNINKSGTRITATLKSLSSNEMLAFETKVNNWLQQNSPDLDSIIASPTLMFSHIGKRNIISMVGGTLLALVIISFLLIVAFRSLKLGLLSLIPNLAPAGVAFGIWALVDGNIGIGLSIVMGMTLGIVVDDTVHFISKYRRARIENSLASEEAVRYAFSTVGSAMWITSAVLVCGFVVLSFSNFLMNSHMGLLTAITIAIALFMDLFLLPPLLMAFDRK